MYIKKVNNKEIGGQIGSDILEALRNIVKKHMYDSPNGLMYHVNSTHEPSVEGNSACECIAYSTN